jgi:hypothetical protein
MIKRFRPPEEKPAPAPAPAPDADLRSRIMVRLLRAAQNAPTEALHSALNYLRDYE